MSSAKRAMFDDMSMICPECGSEVTEPWAKCASCIKDDQIPFVTIDEKGVERVLTLRQIEASAMRSRSKNQFRRGGG